MTMRTLLTYRLAPAFTVFLAIFAATRHTNAEDLEPLKYNHPGLTVDLGVGLWAWPIPCDADEDGDFDLIVSCPDQPSNGIWFFENAEGSTADNKYPVFKAARKLSDAAHYVMPSYTSEGLRVLTPGFEHPNFTTNGLNSKVAIDVDSDFYQPVGNQLKGPKVRHRQWRLADYDGDGLLDLVVAIEDWSDYGWDDAWDAKGEWKNGPLHGFVFIFRNLNTNQSPVYSKPEQLSAGERPLDTYGCPSPNFEDFDGDGDLDLICGEFLDGFTYFQNIGTRTTPVYAPGRRLTLDDRTSLTMDLQMIVPIAFDWDLDGDIDLIVGDEDGRVALIENTGQLDADQTPRFLAPRYFRQEADTLKSGALATPVGFDWDGDGDFDLLSGNTAGYIEYFENLSGPGVENPQWQAPIRLKAGGKTFRVMAGAQGSIQGPAEAKWGYTTISVAEWNEDGLPDIMVNGIQGEVVWLENIGTRQKPELASPKPVEVQWHETVPKPTWVWWSPMENQLVTQWRTTPVMTDWNNDGLMDLMILDQEGYLTLLRREKVGDKLLLMPPERVFFNESYSSTNGKHKVTNKTAGLMRLNDQTAGASGRRKLCVADWNGDGKLDLLVNSINANLLLQTSSDTDTWTFKDFGPISTKNIQGHTTSPTTVDFDGDGKPDFIGGAEDGRFYYLRHSTFP